MLYISWLIWFVMLTNIYAMSISSLGNYNIITPLAKSASHVWFSSIVFRPFGKTLVSFPKTRAIWKTYSWMVFSKCRWHHSTVTYKMSFHMQYMGSFLFKSRCDWEEICVHGNTSFLHVFIGGKRRSQRQISIEEISKTDFDRRDLKDRFR
jgi:hypothetical protein